MKRISLLAVLVLCAGCVAPKAWLWASRPAEILVLEDIRVDRVIYPVTIPAGTYVFIGEDADGYLYRCAEKKMVGESGEFSGAILLFNKFDEVRVVSLLRKDSPEYPKIINASGEIGRYQIDKNLGKQGFAVLFVGHPLSKAIRRKLGLPEEYPHP